MTKSESLIYSILGITRADIRPLAYAVETASELLFVKKISMDDIKVMKHIYPAVAKQMALSEGAVCKRIERIANKCWDEGNPQLLEKIIGRKLADIRAPRDMIFYFAFYVHLGIPFYKVIERSPSLLF